MNMHMPQNALAETELRQLAATWTQIVSPSSNSPIISIYQDSLLGSYRMTRDNVKFSPRTAMNLLMGFPKVNPQTLFRGGAKKEVSSFDVLSQLMPPLTLKYKTKLWDADKQEDPAVSNNILEVYNGQYRRGQIEKSVLGGSTKGIIHRICNDYGRWAAADFIDHLQDVVTEYMKVSSYSVGISDLLSNQETRTRITEAIQEKELEVAALIQKVHAGVIENNTSRSNRTEFENQVNSVLNDATKKTDEISRQSLNPDNRFLMIVNSGSKGSLINISQMVSCLGQVNIDSKRVPYGFDGRTLPHFSKYDDSPGARGFIKNSYIGGLNAHELFFNAMGGRIGLIDTAVKTSQTGYIQRRLIKGLEDLKVEYDMTVRNSRGKIIQFAYGDDGFDPMFVENQTLPVVGMSTQDIYMHYDMTALESLTAGKGDGDIGVFEPGTKTRIKKQTGELLQVCKQYVEEALAFRDDAVKSIFRFKNNDSVLAPVAFVHLINNIQGNLGLAANSLVDITPLEAFRLIEDYFGRLQTLEFAAPTPLFRALYFYYLNPRELLLVKRFHRRGLILLLENVVLKYKQAIVNPGEMVGVVAGQSIGEPTTQLTLNSVTYETEILVRNREGVIKCVQIGDFVKQGIERSTKIEYMKDKDTTYAEMADYYEVPGATTDGRTVWRRIEAVTQHPVVNLDGTNTMLKVTTRGNREGIATKAKSFLCLQNGEIVEMNGSDLKVGYFLPASKKALEFTERFTLDMREVLPPTEYIYTSELEKARSVIDENFWWSKHSRKLFVLPYGRSDHARPAITGGEGRNKTRVVHKPGCVYTTTNNICNYEIPEQLPLDYEFGYLVGAYCAEGCMTKHQISIANNDLNYFAPIEAWCARHNLTTKVYCHENKIQEGWTSQDIRIYSTILCRILEKLCGKLSHNKFISDLIVFSNQACLLGFLDAYIGGDGSVTKCEKRIAGISVASVSLKMLSQVQLILRNFGVIGKIYKPKKQLTNNRGSLDIKQIYNLVVSNEQSKKLGRMLNLPIQHKRERIKQLLGQTFMYDYCKSDLEVPNLIDGEIVMEPRDGRFPDLEFDEIVSIEEVPNTTNYAYDLTVEETRNFDLANGLSQRDTFHNSGNSSKSNVTRGVPRIEEILRLTKNPKNPSMTVFLKPLDEGHSEKAKQFANMMDHTKLADIVSSVQICFDPDEFNTRVRDDVELMEKYYEFSRMVDECNVPDPSSGMGGGASATITGSTESKSRWVVRMEMDTEMMLDKNITMDDIHFAVKNGPSGLDVDCVYSDYNSDKLVFRIRMCNVASTKKRKASSAAAAAAEPLDQTDEIYLLKRFQDDLLNNVVLRGVSGIANVVPRKMNNLVSKVEGKYSKKETWTLDTTGSNLLDTLGLDYIDSTRTCSNDIREVFDVLGIEAARQTIHDEIVEVLEFSGAYANYHHLGVLCDRMTTNKDMVAIFRTGLFSDDIGPIAKATFEVHTEVLLDAARFGEADNMRGVSANVMCGQPGYYGTNAFQLTLDMDAMVRMEAEDLAGLGRRHHGRPKADDHNDDRSSDLSKAVAYAPVDPSRDVNQSVSKSDIVIHNHVRTIAVDDMGMCEDDGYNAGF